MRRGLQRIGWNVVVGMAQPVRRVEHDRSEQDNEHHERKTVLDRSMDQLFSFDGVVFMNSARPLIERWSSAQTYYMPQAIEGTFEHSAVTVMHRNLAEAKEIPADVEVVIGMGIGRGTSQIGVVTDESGNVEVIGYPHGMNNFRELEGLPHAVMDAFNSLPTKVAVRPLLALKSGPLLPFENNAELRKQFTAILRRDVA